MTQVEEIAKNFGYKYEIIKDGSITRYIWKKLIIVMLKLSLVK